MKSKMNIKSIVILATVSIISLFFINMSLAANTGKISVETANLRETADEDSKILEQFSINKEVEIIEKIGTWYKVKVDGITGYLREDLLTINGEVSENTTSSTETNQEQTITETENTTEMTSIIEKNNSAEAKRIVRENTKLKIVPVINATDIIEVKKDEEVNIIESVNGWVCIETQNAKGWIRKEKLQTVEEAQAVKAQEAQAAEQAKQQATTTQTVQQQPLNKTLYVKETSVNVRKEANTNSEIIINLSLNTAVNVTEEANGWSKITVDGKQGYILSSLLSEQKQATSRGQTSERQANAQTTTQQTQQPATTVKETTAKESTTAQAPSGKGNTVIETAKKYIGYKYVYGGASPSTGFDCSGFTSYVYKLHGVSLSRTAAGQASNGVAVARNNLQPGDLVLFSSRSGGGIGHVGIYIGGGQIVHAANSRTGVTTSTINSGYYNSHYVTARRVI